MVRTKADCSGSRTSGAKAPRKVVSQPKPSQVFNASGSSVASYSGGNSYNPQPTPGWQKEITNFFNKQPETKECTETADSECTETADSKEKDTKPADCDDGEHD